MRTPFGLDLGWVLAITLAGALLGFAFGGSGSFAAAAAPPSAPAQAPADGPAAGTQRSGSLFTLVSPTVGSCILDSTVSVRGVAGGPLGPVHVALTRGATVLGSADLVVEQAGPVETLLGFSAHALTGMVRISVTGGHGPGGPLLASRWLGLCASWA